jgi:hypothetical protein
MSFQRHLSHTHRIGMHSHAVNPLLRDLLTRSQFQIFELLLQALIFVGLLPFIQSGCETCATG